MSAKTSGYSGTPLAKKLGIKPGFRIRLINEPDHYLDLIADFPANARILREKKSKKDLIHYFALSAARLEGDIKALRGEIEENGAIWVSWPKLSAKIKTDLNENLVRTIALKHRLVDVKVCAIDETWSALKLVIRLADRKPPASKG